MAPPRVLLDANVLVPSVLRETLLGAAAAGAFVPLWSARILKEWARATRRLPEGAEAVARAEIAALRVAWPAAEIPRDADLEALLALPDPHDVHVLAAAITGGADVILTCDRAGFPGRTLARHGLIARRPDGFLCEIHGERDLGPVVAAVQARAEAASGRPRSLRPMLKRAGLPRLGKALAGTG
jgi:predicted nucleic acid-binding protein